MSLVQAEIRRPSVLKKSAPFELMGPNVSKAIGMKVFLICNDIIIILCVQGTNGRRNTTS